MTSQEFKKLLDIAEKSPEQVARAVMGLPNKVLQYKPATNKWSIQEVLAHLADAELVYGYRLRQAIADKEPSFAPIDQDAWAANLGYMEPTPPELIALYSLLRRANLRVLRRLKPADLDKGGFHPEHKRKVTIAEMTENLAKHGASHLEQIERLKQMAGDAPSSATQSPKPRVH
ncbi:MAG TPA: DinB family protein [Terriglobales bacterium]|nr:DinB family protein [Terriglobales bacterium]